MKTRSQKIATDVAALLRARNPLLWVVTREEGRVEKYLFEAAAAAGYVARTWDVAQGVRTIDGKDEKLGGASPDDTLRFIEQRAGNDLDRRSERGVWIMRDLPVWFENGQIGAPVLRLVRNLARSLPGAPRQSAQSVIVLTPSANVPAELSGHATVIDWPLPDRDEVAAMLDTVIDSLPEYEEDANGKPDKSKPIRSVALLNGDRDEAIDAAVGLTGEEIQACFAKSLVTLRRIDPSAVAQEKRRVIAREKVLEWYDPIPGGLNAVGGLVSLKAWLMTRGSAYTPEAREYGLPAPKGCLIGGIPGTGKSLIAKAIASYWNVPLLRLDMGALKSKFVGDSEQNLRKAFRVIEAIGRCVVWLDEVEKALQGATSGSADGGVSADALGAVLSWMQERSGEAFVIATANDVEALPPELLRKGRFDEVWWVDLPTATERSAILAASMRAHKRDPKVMDVDLGKVAIMTEGFTGSEIAAMVPEAMFAAFNDEMREVGEHREIVTQDLLNVASTTVPLSVTAKDKIDRLRAWAKGKAKPASYVEEVVDSRTSASGGVRRLDI